MTDEELAKALRGRTAEEIERIRHEDAEKLAREEAARREAFIDDPVGTIRYDPENKIIFVRTVDDIDPDDLDPDDLVYGWDVYFRDRHGIVIEDSEIDRNWPILGVLPS